MTYTVVDILLYVLVTGAIGFFVGRAWPAPAGFPWPQALKEPVTRKPQRELLTPSGAGFAVLPPEPAGNGGPASAPPSASVPPNGHGRPLRETELRNWRRRTTRLIEALRSRERTIAELQARLAELERAQAAPQADDLTRIRGIGPKLAQRLSALGIDRFDQIAALSAADVASLESELPAPGQRISRDRWIEQASEILRAQGRA